MPKNPDIKKVLVLGSGPIVIGQAAEFDYAGTQACRALKEEGLEVVLVNSNPATIMTDKDIADHVYIEPLNIPSVTQVIEKERPDSILPTLGGQTGLNLAMALHEDGTLAKYGVKLLGTSPDSIRKAAEDRARQLLAEDTITLQARQRANEMMQQAEERSRELKRSANEYCEDALRRTEEAVAEAYDEIKKSRARFRAAAGATAASAGGSTGSRPIYDAAADED